MKINRKETYSIEDLSKEELLFFLEVVENLQLSSDSSPIAFNLVERFKTFRNETIGDQNLLPKEESIALHDCEGCDAGPSSETQESRICPVTKEQTYLCKSCYEHRATHERAFKIPDNRLN